MDMESFNNEDERIKEQYTDTLTEDEGIPVPLKTLSSNDEAQVYQHNFTASTGQTITLHNYGHMWQAQVSDERFPGFHCSYQTDVLIQPGYSVDQLAEELPAWQAQHVQLLLNSRGKTIVFIGSTGLKGGGQALSSGPPFECVCGFVCPRGRVAEFCNHKESHVNCLRNLESERLARQLEAQRERARQLRYQEVQQELKHQEKLRECKAVQFLIQKELEAQAQWQASRAAQQHASKLQEFRSQTMRQKKIDEQKAKEKVQAAQQAKQQKSSLQVQLKQTILDRLNYVSSFLVKQKEIVLSKNEEITENTTTIATQEVIDTSDYHFVKEAVDVDTSLLPEFANSAVEVRATSSTPFIGRCRRLLQFFGSKPKNLLANSTLNSERSTITTQPLENTHNSSKELWTKTTQPQDHKPKDSIALNRRATLPDIPPQAHLLFPFKKAHSMESLNKQLPFKAPSVSHIKPFFIDGSQEGILSKDECLDDDFVLCEELSSDVFIQDGSLEEFSDVCSTMSLQDTATQITPLKKVSNMDSLDKQQSCIEATSVTMSDSPLDHFLTSYYNCLSSEKQKTFNKKTRAQLKAKLVVELPNKQQFIFDYFRNGGTIYPFVMEQYPASDWLLQSLLLEVVKDPLADPISLEIFQEYWEKIAEIFINEQQIQLLRAILQAKETVNLSLVKVNGILELIIVTGTTGNDIAYDELLDALIHLKKNWLVTQLADLPQVAASASETDQLASAFAASHLSMDIIRDILDALKEAEIVINEADLLEFLTLIKEKAVSEIMVSCVLQEMETSPTGQISRPRQWIYALTCQLLYLQLEGAGPIVSDDIVAAISKKIQQNHSVATLIDVFITNHLESVIINSAEFIGVLELLYTYQVREKICAAVFARLATEKPKNWINATDEVIVTQLFQDSHMHTAEELMKLIAQQTPTALQDPLAASVTNYHLEDNTLESVFKEQVAEALKPCIISQREVLKLSEKDALESWFQDEQKLFREKMLFFQTQKKELDENFNKSKVFHSIELENIQKEEEELETRLDEIKNKWEVQLRNEKRNEEKLREKQYTGTITCVSTELKNQQTCLKNRLDALSKKRDDLQESFASITMDYDNEVVLLKGEEENYRELSKNIETRKNSCQEKIDKLAQENAICFSDLGCYKKVLQSFIDAINDCKLAASASLKESDLSFKSKPICEWNQQEVTNWSACIRRQMQCSNQFSRGIVELIAGIIHAMSLTGTPTPSSNQLFQLLTLLFPFFEQEPEMPMKDPLIVIMLAVISVMHMGQVSLITDSKIFPLSKSEIKQYHPLFEILSVMATKKSIWDSRQATTDKSHIIYGTFFQFKNQGSNLIAYHQLKKTKNAVNKHYEAPSAILQDAEAKCSQLKDKIISSWNAQDIYQWANYVQKVVCNYSVPTPPAVSLEYMAVIKRAVVLTHKTPPTTSQLFALFTSLDHNLDKSELMKKDQKEALVMVMSAAVTAFQREDFDVTSVFNQLPTSSSDEHLCFFKMLNLEIKSLLPRESLGTITLATNHAGLEEHSEAANTPSRAFKANSSKKKHPAIVGETNGNYNLLKQAYAAVDAAYRGPSSLFKCDEDGIPLSIYEWRKTELSRWATRIVTMHEPNLLIKAELIAGVKRAVELAHGISPRDVQILTLLTLLSESDKGCLAQVNTGEGKSLIIAMLAAIHALQGKQVDVVTTSTELTKPEVAKQRPFFKLLHLTVAENSEENYKEDAYKCHIVYGTSIDFQGDILRQEFLGHGVRGYRKHDIVLVDEVDSLLFDNRTHSVRLSAGNNPGMQHVTLLFGIVWYQIQKISRHMLEYDGQIYFIPDDFKRTGTEIQLASGILWEDYTDKIAVQNKRQFITKATTAFLEESLRELNDEERQEYQEHLNKRYEKTVSEKKLGASEIELEILEKKLEALQEKLDAATDGWMFGRQGLLDEQGKLEDELKGIQERKEALLNECEKLDKELEELPWKKRDPIIEVPKHLQNFAKNQISHWIENGLNALNVFEKNAHYTVVDDRIVPIQYRGTGVLESNMVWSDGLTQFLQIKEGLAVEPESMSSNFMSNVGFFKRYGDAIYGLTGTLGGEATQSFLRELYDTDLVIIPPHIRRIIQDNDRSPYLCKELASIIVESVCGWNSSHIEDILHHAQKRQAVLVICKCTQQVHDLAQTLKGQYDPEKIFTYIGEGASVDKKTMDSGEIIVATDVINWGIGISTSNAVENNGGLYITETFLPWYSTIIKQVLHHAKQKRAALVICKYIKQAHDLLQLLKEQYDPGKVFLYTGEDDSFAKETIHSGEIIIATNIAGRGTDLKPSKTVEDHGGLYVAITFLPESYRVELQNVGRTARAGNKGMAQLIICRENGATVESLKADRNMKEEVAIEMAKEEAKTMLLQDALFQNFCQLEAKYLPSVQDCENVRLAATLIPQWETYLNQNGSDDVIASKFQEWKSEKRQKWQEQDKSGLDIDNQNLLDAQFEHDLAQEELDFHQCYRTKLLEEFNRGQPTIPPAIWHSLVKGIPFASPMSAYAEKNEWGIFERKAVEERWALWLNSKHVEKRDTTDVLSLLEEFDNEFKVNLENAAYVNELVENPFFYVLKGNESVNIFSQAYFKYNKEHHLEKAINYYDQAIRLDPIFSVYARYNKARALLSITKNIGERQKEADQELLQAEIIIDTIYRPRLLSFNSLIRSEKMGTGTVQHIQYQLNIMSQLEKYIHEAREVLKSATKEKNNVKLSNHLVEQTFSFKIDQFFDKAIKEVNTNGLLYLFILGEKLPTPWLAITSVALIGLTQITLGVLLTCTTGTGLSLITEGISDVFTAVRAGITGSFSWSAYATRKAISLAITLATAGFSKIAQTCEVIKDTAKSLLASTTRETVKDSFILANKVLVTELGKGAFKEILSEAGQFAIDELILTKLENRIQNQVEETLIKDLATNQLVVIALEQDKRNNSNYWQRTFIQDGCKLLANESVLGSCLSIAGGIGMNLVGKKMEKNIDVQLIQGVTDMLIKLATHTRSFLREFNQQVEKHREEILSTQHTDETATISDSMTTESRTPRVDLDEEHIVVDKVSAFTNYSTERTVDEKPLSVDFDNIGPPSIENLVHRFKGIISNELMNSVQQSVQVAVETATRKLTGQLFKQIDAANAQFLTITEEKWQSGSFKNRASATNKGDKASSKPKKAKKKKAKKTKCSLAQPKDTIPELTTDTKLFKKSLQTVSSKDKTSDKTPKLTAETKSFKKSFQEVGPKDKTSLVPVSAVTGRTIEIYNKEGDRTSVVKSKKKKKGQSIKIVFEPGENGEAGHYRPYDEKQIRNLNCGSDSSKGHSLMDAILAQLPDKELLQLGGSKGVIQKGVDHIDAESEEFNQLCEKLTRTQQVLKGFMYGGVMKSA